ncbi:MAG: hypothetical protein ACRCXA_07345 [Peptostreptococcaceae bacterium]
MSNLIVNVTERNAKGRNLRKNGYIPCIVYGQGLDSTVCGKITVRDSINILEYNKNAVLSLNINEETKQCILKSLQRDAMGNLLHIDFLAVNND